MNDKDMTDVIMHAEAQFQQQWRELEQEFQVVSQTRAGLQMMWGKLDPNVKEAMKKLNPSGFQEISDALNQRES